MALSGRILRWSVVAGGACLILYLWRRTEEAGDLEEAAELQRAQAERLLTKVRIEALQRQIEPHFLFNTLATVRRLQRSSPDDGRRLLSRLMNFLYANFDSRAGADQLGRELTVVEAYLDVCAMRMGGLLCWSINVPAELHKLKFPRFGLATLVENAVKHGIAPSPAGGTITVVAHVYGGMLELSVIDTGRGFAADHGTGIGLANIAAHLRLCYGDTASLRLAANSPSGVCATIRLSAQTGP